MLHKTEIQIHEVQEYLQKIYPYKSTDPDEVSLLILKECCAQLVSPITHLFNKSPTQVRAPCSWKRTNITSILKKGDKKQVINYCLISLTSVLIKLIASRLCVHMHVCKCWVQRRVVKEEQGKFYVFYVLNLWHQ